MSKTFSIMPDLRLFQAFTAADIKDGDGKEEDRHRNENYVLHKNLPDCSMSKSECPGCFRRVLVRNVPSPSLLAGDTLASEGLGSNEMNLRIL